MSCIACLTSLTHLGLSRTYCSDSLAFNNSLAGLASLSVLRHLDLSNTEADGTGLEKFCTALQVGISLILLHLQVSEDPHAMRQGPSSSISMLSRRPTRLMAESGAEPP